MKTFSLYKISALEKYKKGGSTITSMSLDQFLNPELQERLQTRCQLQLIHAYIGEFTALPEIGMFVDEGEARMAAEFLVYGKLLRPSAYDSQARYRITPQGLPLAEKAMDEKNIPMPPQLREKIRTLVD
jgi:hypothetical protein